MRRSVPQFVRVGVALFLTVAHFGGASAQQLTGVAAADSSTVARAAWRRAGAALNAHDLEVARREVRHAAQAWPTQHAYVWARAVLSAGARDTAETLGALQDYARLGLGRDLRADTSFKFLFGIPVFAALIARHDSNRAPFVRSTMRATLADSTFWPEGMDFDPRSKRFFVASVRHRTIAVIDSTGATRELWPRGRRDLGAILGVRVDTLNGTLWATTSGVRQIAGYQPSDSGVAALLRIRQSDGAIERRWDVAPVAGGHVLGDLGVGPHGDVFLTDSNQPVLYWLRPGADSLETIRNPLFHSLQGLAPSPDGRVLYLSDYSHGLLRVDLTTRRVTRLDDVPNSTSLGCDGIAWDRAAILAVQNGVSPARVMRFVLDASGTRIARAEVLDQNGTIADEPTIGAVVGDMFVYVANSQWEKHDDDGKRLPGRPLTAPVLLSVRLPR